MGISSACLGVGCAAAVAAYVLRKKLQTRQQATMTSEKIGAKPVPDGGLRLHSGETANETPTPLAATPPPDIGLRLRGGAGRPAHDEPMRLDLGFMKVHLEGKYNIAKAGIGIAWAASLLVGVFHFATMAGPAVKAADLTAACQVAGLVTCGWSLLYYNMIGAQVDCAAATHFFDMVDPKTVDPSFMHVATRFHGNMLEQAPVFLSSLWTYTLFADWVTGGYLGVLYLVTRFVYPFYYMYLGEFTFDFETCTQVGYGVIGVLILGTLVSLTGGDWVAWASSAGALAPIAGLFLGSLALFPGLPLGPFIAYAHLKLHKAYHKKKSD